MKISTRGRYALRLMLDLALRGKGGSVPLKDVAERQQISEKYLEQIITPLCRAGYVKSARGAQGGYKLARPAEEYTVGSVLRLIEGSLAPVACMEDEPNICPRASRCATLDVYKRINDAVNDIVDNITLADLAEKQREKTQN